MSDRGAPLFSIVLPTHNSVATLPFAIQSALAQTFTDFELLIAGDGAAPGTAEAARSFDDARVIWMDLPKARGIGYGNRNRAIERARGRYIAYLADDDLWLPDHLERCAAVLEGGRTEFVYSRLLTADIEHRLIPAAFNVRLASHRAGFPRREMEIGLSCVVHSRECLARYGYWDEEMPRRGDWELWLRICDGSTFGKVAFLPDVTAVRFVARRHVTATYRRQAWLTQRLIGKALDDMLPDALRVNVPDGELPQSVLWRRLTADGGRAAAALRSAVADYHDAVLWRSRGNAGRFGLRCAWAVARAIRRIRRAVQLLPGVPK